MHPRFLTRRHVAEELNISMAQCYALIRRGERRAAKIGARGDHRIGLMDLEAYIERAYAETERRIDKHPFTEDGHMILALVSLAMWVIVMMRV